MTTNIFVLLMIWQSGTQHGGISVVQQEFNSFKTCEVARIALVKSHNIKYPNVQILTAQGCFKK